MTHDEFHAILQEEGYVDADIEELWMNRPHDDLKPNIVRMTAENQVKYWLKN